MTKLLSEFGVGESGKILSVNGAGAVRRRLFDMGVTPGADVLLRKKAPLGDPLELYLRGYTMTLRKEDAARIEVRPKEEI